VGLSPERTIGSRRVFDGRLLQLCVDRVSLPDGGEAERELVHHPGAAAVVPLDDPGTGPRVTLLRQYRYAVGAVLWEVPAGIVEPGESPEDCARRELREEAGLIAGTLRRLTAIETSPGFCDEKIDLFLATDLVEGDAEPEVGEVVELHRLDLERALEMVEDGSITNGVAVAALLLVGRQLGM
jgi:ADP-ribose pyrophosphatase